MRLCASLFRGVAAPLGCAVLMPLFVQYDLERWKDLTKRSGRVMALVPTKWPYLRKSNAANERGD